MPFNVYNQKTAHEMRKAGLARQRGYVEHKQEGGKSTTSIFNADKQEVKRTVIEKGNPGVRTVYEFEDGKAKKITVFNNTTGEIMHEYNAAPENTD